MAYRLPKLFPQPSQVQEKGFSLVWVLSCLWTCSTRLRRYISASVDGLELVGDTHLNHLLQYLQGRVLGLGGLPSPFPSGLDAGGPCGDWTESMIAGRLQCATSWGAI